LTDVEKTFGFHPLTAFADYGADGTGEPLAIVLRPGNARSNTAAPPRHDRQSVEPATSPPSPTRHQDGVDHRSSPSGTR
jgi:hypothetical protein